MAEYDITFHINGSPESRTVATNQLLRDFIRNDLGLKGTKAACEDGMCGACSIHLDGKAVKSCLLLAVEADGASITTIEGLGGDAMHPVQEAMIDNFGFQCGFCTPGFIMTISALLEDEAPADSTAVKESLVGNICRCTGYTRIVAATLDAARRIQSTEA